MLEALLQGDVQLAAPLLSKIEKIIKQFRIFDLSFMFKVIKAVAVCIAFNFLILKGAWANWANFTSLPGTEERWFPLEFEQSYRGKVCYEVNDISRPAVLGWMETVFNDGESYEKTRACCPILCRHLSMAVADALCPSWLGALA